MAPTPNTNIEDIRIQVTCPACHNTYGIQLQKPHMRRNCRCGGGTFLIDVLGMQGRVEIKVWFEYPDTTLVPITIPDIEIGD
jgi:hypothetical protein